MAASDQLKTSLYVGDLHPEVTEKDLIDTFSCLGPLLSVHLCRDRFSGTSRRYAYVNFWLPCHAISALKSLNHTNLRGKSIRIMWYERYPSARKNGIGNVFVKNLDKSITSARLETVFSRYGTILSCKVVEENGISKGFGFVQFDSEDSAMAALAALHDTELEGKRLYVSRFQRKAERKGAGLSLRRDMSSEHRKVSALGFDSHEAPQTAGPNSMESKASNLFVKNLDASVDNKKLEELFSTYGKVISAKVIQAGGVSRGFGFVCFSNPDDAKKALISLSGSDFEGRTLYVAVAWPKKKGTDYLYKSSEKFPPQSLYTSNCYYPPLSPPIPLYQNFISPCNSPNLVQAHNITGTFHASPLNPATLTVCEQGKYLGMWNGQKSPSTSPGKIINGVRKELCWGFGTAKTSCMGPYAEINKIKRDLFLQKLQPMQLGKLNGQQRFLERWKGLKPCGLLQGKLTNGDGKEVRKGSGSMNSSPVIEKTTPVYMRSPLAQNHQARQPGNANVTPDPKE